MRRKNANIVKDAVVISLISVINNAMGENYNLAKFTKMITKQNKQKQLFNVYSM